MVAKIHNIQHSKVEYTCAKCKDTIPANTPYRYFKPGYMGRLKVKRCMKPECTPTRSELDNSKLAEVYATQEDAEKSIAAATTIADIESALESVKDAAEGVHQEYEEAVEAAPMMNVQMEERMNALDSYMSEIDSFSPDDLPELGDDPDSETQAEYDEALESIREEALTIVNSFEF
jgi:hypothetical protein